MPLTSVLQSGGVAAKPIARLLFAIILVALSLANTLPIASAADSEPSTDAGNADCNLDNENDSCSPDDTVSDVGSVGASNLPSARAGNPINLMTGNKSQKETDFAIPGAMLGFNRLYNSGNGDNNLGLGQGWHHSYAVSLYDAGNGAREIVQSNGTRVRFKADGEDEQGRPLMRGTAPHLGYVIQTATHHEWYLPDGRMLQFQSSYLVRIDWPDQRRLELFYKARRLHSVTDETGRVLRLEYHAGVSRLTGFDVKRFGIQAGHLKSLTLPDGSLVQYDYDNNRNLSRVRYSDGTSREYHYESDVYPNHLTGITDRLGIRFASWSYDDHGRAISSEHADGVEKLTVEFPDPKAVSEGGIVDTMVTNSQGFLSRFTWQQRDANASPLLLSSEGAGCATCPPTGYEYSYDEQGRLLSSRNTGLGNAVVSGSVLYRYDEQGRLLDIYESMPGEGEKLLASQRYVENTDRVERLVRRSVNADGELVTQFTYNAEGLPIRVDQSGYAPSSIDSQNFVPISRSTELTYENQMLVSIDGPRSDVDDTTRFVYDELKRLVEVHPPAGPVLRTEQFDSLGRPVSLRIGSQRAYQLSFDEGSRIRSVSQSGQSIYFGYDAEGRVVSLTDPYGRITRIDYDPAGRALSLTDDAGRVTQWSRDSESRLSGMKEMGLDGVEIRSLAQVFNTESHVTATSRGSLNATTGGMVLQSLEFERDIHGNILSSTDTQAGHATLLERDDAGQLVAITAADGARTEFEFDAKGQPVAVIDARGNKNQRLRDDFGRVLFVQSPDTGLVINQYDAANNRIRREDAIGAVTTFTWDAGNRLLQQSSDAEQTNYRYDDEGRLIAADNNNAQESFAYDSEGLMVEHVRTLDSYQFATRYEYDAVGRAIRKTLPDGQALRYHYHESGNNRGKLRAITRESLFGLSQETLIAEIDMDARDGATGYLAFNGRRTDYRFATNGELETIEIDQALQLEYRYDDAGRIIGIDEAGTVQSFRYEANRLIGANTRTGKFEYRYDDVGNRTSSTTERTDGSIEQEQYRYPAPGAGNRLLGTVDEISGRESQIDYNAAGSPENVSATGRRFEYNAQQRPISVYEQGQLLAEYRYNAFGERIAKVVYSSSGTPTVTYFLHDGNRLSAEIKGDGSISEQYVYLDDQRPVLKLRGEQVFAIHGDHLGTPRVMSAADGGVVWEASYDPFGAATLLIADEPLSLRLPGQYFDAETGTHYNRFRDYDPATGRYLTSDPIGLEGGINTYAYAEGLPTMLADVLGLATDPDAAPLIQKPDASFASKLEYVMEHVAAKLVDEGTKAVFEKFKDDLVGAAVVMAGIAVAAGVALGTAAAVSGGAALPVAVGALASAASAVGVAALWATGFEGVKFLYDIISIGVSIYGTPHTDCAALKRSADEMFDKVTSLASGVLSNVTTFGIGRVINKLSDVFKFPNRPGRCSFDGDTLVLARDGYVPIRDIQAGQDQVWSRSEQTGESGWKGVLAQYSNTYEETVHTTVRDNKGGEHTLVSNRIHPFFARVAAGVLLTVAAEGHVYAGEIENGAWVDAQHLQAGYELLGSDDQWQRVVSTDIESVELDAYNLTVDGYSTYYVSGDGSAAGVWVHNVCFDNRPDYFSERVSDTTHGHPVWRDPVGGEEVYEAWDHLTQKYRYYNRKDHSPSPRPTGLIGVEFENFLKNKLGGESSFSSGGRDFDGRIGDRWLEAKSGRYWEDIATPGPGFDKFKSDMGSRLSIARSNGASYELHSNTPIPDYAKDWLTSKGIKYFEHY